MEYIVVTIIGFVLGMIYNSGKKDSMDSQIMGYLKLGKRVIVCVDNDATIFEMIDNRIRISKAETSIMEEPVELPVGVKNELVTDSMDSGGSDQSGNYNEAGLAD